MALGIDRDKYRAMVKYIRANVGGVLTVDPPKPGELVKNHRGDLVAPVHATKDKEELFAMVYHYLERYNSYPDEPLIEFNNEKSLLYIKGAVTKLNELKTK